MDRMEEEMKMVADKIHQVLVKMDIIRENSSSAAPQSRDSARIGNRVREISSAGGKTKHIYKKWKHS